MNQKVITVFYDKVSQVDKRVLVHKPGRQSQGYDLGLRYVDGKWKVPDSIERFLDLMYSTCGEWREASVDGWVSYVPFPPMGLHLID